MKPDLKQKFQERSPKAQWQSQSSESNSEEELPLEPFQHMQFLDCDSEIGRVIFECYHCKQGIMGEYTGERVMGEYKGRPKSDFHKGKMPQL
jgi:hypothetical protein